MVGIIKTLLAALVGLAAVPIPAAPAPEPAAGRLDERQTKVVTTSTTGSYGGYWFSNYVESGTNTLTLGSGTYSLKWSASNVDVVSGIGWSTGSAR